MKRFTVGMALFSLAGMAFACSEPKPAMDSAGSTEPIPESNGDTSEEAPSTGGADPSSGGAGPGTSDEDGMPPTSGGGPVAPEQTPGGGGAAPDASGEPSPPVVPDPEPPPDPSGGGAGGAEPTPPAEALTVQGFKGTHVYFAGEDNKRSVDADAMFPELNVDYSQVLLKFTLGCPLTNAVPNCDFWDRKGTLSVVQGSGDDEKTIEVLRFMTPYRVGGSWQLDVTELRPLLSGDVKLRVFIDTWVGPGHAQGAGWLVDAAFEFVPGSPKETITAVIPLWDSLDVIYGNPEKPIAETVVPQTAAIPPGSTVRLRALISGHGQGNKDNCAEFCPKEHRFSVAGKEYKRRLWRDDCALNPVSNQAGNWRPSRAGWCPGDIVIPWSEEIDASGDATVSYDVEAYENTCRPDSPSCAGCAFGGSCEYNDGNHTIPHYRFSAQLIVIAP